MKTLIRAARKPQRSIVPVASFEFETFEVRVRRVTRHKPLVVGAASGRLNTHLPSSQPKTIVPPIDPPQPADIFLPSPSLQGRGSMRLHLGARSVDHPAALSSRQLRASASDPIPKKAHDLESIASRTHN